MSLGEPYPAIVVERHWEVVAGNRCVEMLTAGAAAELLEPSVNAMRLALHPEGPAPRSLDFAEWRAHLLERLERQLELTGEAAVGALREELRGYPGGAPGYVHEPSGHDLFIPLRMRGEKGEELSFFSTVATFGAAVDVTAAELSIESFPADRATAAAISLSEW